MPYCEKCESERPDGAVYCAGCGSRMVPSSSRASDDSPEVGRKSGDIGGDAEMPQTAVAAGMVSGVADIWNVIGYQGRFALLGAVIAFVGFFVPTNTVTLAGDVLTNSLALIGSVFYVVPVLSVTAIVLIFTCGVPGSVRSRMFLLSMVVAIGAFCLPFGLYAWAGGLAGGLLIVVGTLLLVASGFGMMSSLIDNPANPPALL